MESEQKAGFIQGLIGNKTICCNKPYGGGNQGAPDARLNRWLEDCGTPPVDVPECNRGSPWGLFFLKVVGPLKADRKV